ncbi:putative holin-like toxin [Alkalihalobacillus sp. AL-G]|uniref:putative holin-like toxin n=1 Tax=Alkalihalobacillus sp. AL-G TaxID=2926399 RepID=UPI002729DD8D|nr:putative holin-like toxin [Alkalihalobacillus sp. AL-G]WLD91916.1 putative holin-like toxin [Alkalihalobacillus sp. AL-G]
MTLKGGRRIPVSVVMSKQKRGDVMTAYEAISLMLTFGLLIVTLLAFPTKRK